MKVNAFYRVQRKPKFTVSKTNIFQSLSIRIVRLSTNVNQRRTLHTAIFLLHYDRRFKVRLVTS